MKLASLKQGRDGQLIIVSRDLTHAVHAHHIAPTLQFALDNWPHVEADLAHLYHNLNNDDAPDSFGFNPERCASLYHERINGPMAVRMSIMSS